MSENYEVSPARIERRGQLKNAALTLVGTTVPDDFDLHHAPLCAIDVLMVSGAPWLKIGLEKDFLKDKSGYRKIGGRGNTPLAPYFYRSTANVIHYLKRQGFYLPRGSDESPVEGMACFFDFEDRGRFNFTPDRSGIITKVAHGSITEVVIAQRLLSPHRRFEVSTVNIALADGFMRALIGYCDLP